MFPFFLNCEKWCFQKCFEGRIVFWKKNIVKWNEAHKYDKREIDGCGNRVEDGVKNRRRIWSGRVVFSTSWTPAVWQDNYRLRISCECAYLCIYACLYMCLVWVCACELRVTTKGSDACSDVNSSVERINDLIGVLAM